MKRNNNYKINFITFALSVFSLFICIGGFIGTTWGFFTQNKTTLTSEIKTANYNIENIEIYEINEQDLTIKNLIELTNDNDKIILSSNENTLYEVNINTGGTATSGYVRFKLGDTYYYSKNINIKFNINSLKTEIIEIETKWGPVNEDYIEIENEATINYE